MFIIHRGQPTPFFFSPTESFMGLFMFSLLDFGSTYETFEVQELSHLLKVKKQPNCPPPPIAVLLTNATLYLVNYLVGHFNHFEFRAQNLSDCVIIVMHFTLVLNFVKNIQGDYIYFKKYLQKGKNLHPQYFEPWLPFCTVL